MSKRYYIAMLILNAVGIGLSIDLCIYNDPCFAWLVAVNAVCFGSNLKSLFSIR